ncbi:hypothetical protein GGH94_004455 [Coemansia aciculifera]|uniref:Cleft lip and palate transmembrane 1 n=1 Tax=Coemansia aciculifera TaxID=417176 RepID=A0A9W8M4T8_9FUNG|nr:hypothetical protein GGH94_004455 [Coemansia aciculifera]
MLLILAVPAALLVLLLVLTFKTPTIAPAKVFGSGEYQEPTYSLAWQEPFAYEAKVYATLSSSTLNNASFFETAQLLWHIEPQQLTNRYPVFRNKVNVHIPSQLRSSPSADHSLYAYMFVQKAGRFNPHPDFTDPYLVSKRVLLAHWSNSTSKYADTTSPVAPKLLGVSSASWAIVLENHSYTRYNIPSYLKAVHGHSNTVAYSPPLLANTFTKGRPEEKPLVALKDTQLVADVYQQTIDVDLELSGIRQDWVSMKTGLTGIFARNKTVVVKTTFSDPLNPGKMVTHVDTVWVEGDDLAPFDAVHRLSMPALIYSAMCFALLFAMIPAFIRLLVRLWSTPISRWIGASRASVAIMLIGGTMNTVGLAAKDKAVWIRLHPLLIAMAFVAAKLDDMTLAPWAALSQMCRKIFRRKPSSDIARSSSMQQLSLVAENKAELNSTSVSAVSNPYFRRPEPIIAIRREIDEIAMRWVYLLTIPVIALMVLYMLVDQGGKFWSLEFIEGVFTWSSRIFFCASWLPQIIINYKTKSGSLTPVTYNIIELFSSVLRAIFKYLVGSDMLGGITMYFFLNELCNVIIILQRIVYYRRAKQD